jgi:sorbitol/mannitol transport system permease protein
MAKPTEKPHRRAKLMRTWPLLTPAVGVLLLWAFIPLAMTLWFSFQRYNLVDPTTDGFAGFSNYKFLVESPAFLVSIFNELVMVAAVLVITLVLGVAFAVLFDQEFPGRTIARLLVIAPFFVMPTVAALVWKNLLMDPVNGVFAYLARSLGLAPLDWFTHAPMAGVVMIVAWEWVPFATLILLTAMQSLDHQQVEAAKMDGARGPQILRYVILPHLSRPITIVLMMETIYLLAIFAEIFVTTSGGPGNATTTLTYLIYQKALVSFDVGGASAGGVIAVILANIVALFLIRSVARNVDL